MTTLMSSALVDPPTAQTHTPSSPTAPAYTQQPNYPPRTSSSRVPYSQSGPSHDAASAAPSLEPPSGMTYAQYVNTWTDAHIARWLADSKCGHQAHTFEVNDIRGDVLLELDQPTLKEMGINSIGDRVRIMNALKGLRQKCSSRNVLAPAPDANRPGSHSRTSSASGGKADNSISPVSRLASTRRPAPLQLSQAAGRHDLPRLVRDGQDSARSRPQQQPTPNTATPSSAIAPPTSIPTPAASTPYSSASDRNRTAPPPPPPRLAAPIPPGNRNAARNLHPVNNHPGYRTPTQAEVSSYASAPLPPPPPPCESHPSLSPKRELTSIK